MSTYTQLEHTPLLVVWVSTPLVLATQLHLIVYYAVLVLSLLPQHLQDAFHVLLDTMSLALGGQVALVAPRELTPLSLGQLFLEIAKIALLVPTLWEVYHSAAHVLLAHMAQAAGKILALHAW